MKKRIIPSIILKNGTNVLLSRKFEPWRTVGTLVQQLRLQVSRESDELLIINLDSAGKSTFSMSKRISALVRREVNIPISYIGGIRNADDASECINAGFDKVFITSTYIDEPKTVEEITSVIGVQSLGVCLPYAWNDKSKLAQLWDYRTRKLLPDLLFDHIDMLDKINVGEIFLYNIEKDGSLKGMDLNIRDQIEKLEIKTPILLGGGAGNSIHVKEILESPFIQGIVAGSIFALTENTPETLRSHCAKSGISMRVP